MKLRDQLRTDKGTFYNWPPIWTNRQDPTDKQHGEIGNLTHVWMSEDDDNIIFIARSAPSIYRKIDRTGEQK
jgi:hypothetical protein